MKKLKDGIISILVTVIIVSLIIFLILFGLVILGYINTEHDYSGTETSDFETNITIKPSDNLVSKVEIPQILSVENEPKNITTAKETTNYSNSNIDMYFYNQLDDYSKILYSALYLNKDNLMTGTYEIKFGNEFDNLLSNDEGVNLLNQYYQSAIEAFSYDNPDVFYIEYKNMFLNVKTIKRLTGKKFEVYIGPSEGGNYLCSQFADEASVRSAVNEVENVRNYFQQRKSSNVEQNIKMVHDYLVDNVDYDESVSRENTYNIYGALIEKSCVCEGYAKAFKYLIDPLGIPCVLVSGVGTNSEGKTENHAWNYVQIDDNWYAVDCTWDDPIIIGNGRLTNKEKYKYFLKGSKDFSSAHKEDGKLTENGKEYSYPNLSYNNY